MLYQWVVHESDNGFPESEPLQVALIAVLNPQRLDLILIPDSRDFLLGFDQSQACTQQFLDRSVLRLQPGVSTPLCAGNAIRGQSASYGCASWKSLFIMPCYQFRAKEAYHLVNHRSVAREAEILLFGAQSLFPEFDREQHPVVNPKQALEHQLVLRY